MRRRRAAIDEASRERARLAARAEELDRRVYEEELAESLRALGAAGVNPRVDVLPGDGVIARARRRASRRRDGRRRGRAAAAADVTVAESGADGGPATIRTEFSFARNRRPLRFAAGGAAAGDAERARRHGGGAAEAGGAAMAGCEFVPLNIDREMRRPVASLCCPKGHQLDHVDYGSYVRCYRCKPKSSRGCSWLCHKWCARARSLLLSAPLPRSAAEVSNASARPPSRSYYWVCRRCQSTHKRATLKDRADPAGKPTFLRASPGTSFTLQLPRARSPCAASGGARAVVRAGGEPATRPRR